MQPGDLDKELDRLWAKVTMVIGGDPEIAPSSGPNAHELTLDTIAMLKRRHAAQASAWSDMVDAKERALRALRERELQLQAELVSTREQLQASETRVVGEVLDAKTQLEAGIRALEEEKARGDEEQRVLREVLEATRRRLAIQTEQERKTREAWEKRELQYLADIRELQDKLGREEQEIGRAEQRNDKLETSVKEAKNALEKTLSELLEERRRFDEAQKERSAAVKKAEELDAHFKELEKIWAEERAQWRELWDRERSTWETQRREFSSWEEGLRRERQAWSEELAVRQDTQARYATQINEALRKTGETATRLGTALKVLLGIASAASSGRELGRRIPRKLILAVCLAGIGALAWKPVANWAGRPDLELLGSTTLPVTNPTSLAYDGELLWVSEWEGIFKAIDLKDPSRVVRQASFQQPYHPVATAFGGSYMWSLDAAQARVIRHKAASPDVPLASRAAPGPAPTALAFDGESVWSYDAVNKALYRHGRDEGETKAFALGEEAVPTTMAWVGGKLWLYDSRSGDVLVFAFEDGVFDLRHRARLGKTVIGLASVGREILVLTGPDKERQGYELIRYKH